jgi:hypothetical protein
MAVLRQAARQPRPQAEDAILPRRYAEPVRTLMLWLQGTLGNDPLVAAGLDRADLEELRAGMTEAEKREVTWLCAAGRVMTKELMAKLARGRLAEAAMAARTHSEVATLARAIRSLPDWVWDGATGLPGKLLQHAAGAAATAQLAAQAEPGLNRAERRRLARLDR